MPEANDEAQPDFETPPERDFAGALERLARSGGTPEVGLLGQLSDPTRADMAEWRARWPLLDEARRRAVMSGLVEAAEADFALHFDPLYEAALDDRDPTVRSAAIDGLWESEEPRLVDRFVTLMRQDLDAGVRGRAASALAPFAQLAEMEDLPPERSEQLVRALVDTAEDESEDVDVRRRATEAVGFLDTPEVRSLIERHAESDERQLQAGALVAMGRSGRRAWTPLILAGLEAGDPLLRFASAQAAGEMGTRAAVPALVPLADSDDVEIRLAAIWALGEIGGARARRALEALAASADDDTVAEAIDDALAMVSLDDAAGDLMDLMALDPDAIAGREGSAGSGSLSSDWILSDDEDDEDDGDLDDALGEDGLDVVLDELDDLDEGDADGNGAGGYGREPG
jgi:HEAT repeat protein